MGAIHSAILYLEERSYDNSTASHAAVVRPLVKLLLFPSVADRLYKNRIYRLIGSSALQSFLGIVILYCVFVAIYYPFHLIGLVITPIGSFSIFLLGVLLLLRWFARSLTFPGYTPYLQRQLSQEYLKAFARQLGEFYTVSAEVWYCSLLVLNGMPQESQQKRIQFGLKDLTVLSTHLIPQILINLERLVEEFSDSAPSPLSVQELSTLESLKEVIADLLARSHNAIAGPVGVALKGLSGQNVTSLMQLDLCLRPLAADKEAIASVVAAFEATEKLKTSLNIIMKPREPVNPSMLATIKKSISSVYSRPEGFERISFPLMRFSIGVQYSTTRFAVFGPDNNKIDCMFISECSSVESRDRFAEATSASVFEPLPLREGGVGVVLFCNPNAAIYEALSMTPRKGSYVGIYIDMGYDVVVYNYRGYACSEGTPTPDRLNADGLAVATYITRTIKSKIAFSADSGTNTNRTAPRFIVHGQSLGGMVACHVASCSPAGAVDLLVCDRTFASLDAVASRMLGGWAGTGLRQLACWNSNSVASFLNAKCTKLLLQDPNDEIIYHSASLKCGVATYLALKENLWSVRRFDRKFVIAAYVGSPVPLDTVATAAGSLLVRDGGDLSVVERSTAFMASLYSSALPDHSDSVWNAVASAIQLIRRGAVSAVGCAVAGPMPRHEDGAILTECFVQHLAACLLDVHTKTTRYNKNKEQARNKRSEDNDDELDVHVDAHVVVVDSAVRDVADEMWVVIMKIGSDGCGQLLGHAVSKGFDEIRSWVCCFLVFSHITVHDPQLPDVAISLQTGFYALKAIANRLTEACDTDNSSLNSLNSQQRKNKVGISAQVTEFCKVLAFLLDGFELLISLNSEHVDLLSEYESNAETDCRKVDKSGVRYSRSETHPTCGTTTLLPLHCGHNGLPTAAEVAMLVSLIKQKTGVSRGAY